MKRLITCAGLAAVGVATMDAQPVGEPSVSKPWSVSAKVRGFYDDNYNTAPNNPAPGYPYQKAESWGFSVAPSIGANLLRDQTTLGVRYDFDLRWYEARKNDNLDMYHNATLNLSHRFSERYRVELYDNFIYSDEPSVFGSGQQDVFVRTDNNNLRNYGGIGFYGSFTEYWGYRLGYENTYYDYSQDGAGSLSALLDRIENKVTADIRRLIQPTTTALLGYSFQDVSYTADEYLINPAYAPGVPLSNIPMSDYRNYRSHIAFLGLDHDFTTQLNAQLRAGAQYADYYNADDDFIVPYADATLGYKYAEGSQVQLGIKHGMSSTDIAVDYNLSGVVLASESTTLYAGLSHRITPKLTANVRGQWQMLDYRGTGAGYDGQSDNYYSADVGLVYTINQYLAVDAGYLFDRLDSDIPNRTYDRNRAYVGIRGTY